MSPIKRLKRFVVGCNNEYSSHQLLPTPDAVTFALKGMRRSPICLNAYMFARIIRDPASSTEDVSIRVFL